jgi:conjugative relaxase-like TrwC/TraI family protein
MLTVKRIHAGRGAVDYYLNQTRNGMADYYLTESGAHRSDEGDGSTGLSAPAASWWGGGADALELSGEVQRAQFVPLYAKAVHPSGGYLGRKFRLPEEADAAKADELRAAAEIADPYERWMAKHETRRKGGHASVAAWDCTFSPPKSVSLLWAAGDREVQQQVWAAHLAAVDAGLSYLQEHAAYVRAGAQGVRVLDTTGLVVARMNEWTSRDGDMHLHTHCLILNRAQTAVDGKWRALDGRAVLAARTGAGALYNRVVEAELTRRLGVGWRDRPDGLRELDGVDDELIAAFSSRRRAITAAVTELAAAYRDKYGVDAPPAVLSAMAQNAWAGTRQPKRDLTPREALEQWEATARRRGRSLARLPRQVLGRADHPHTPALSDAEVAVQVLERLAETGRPTFTRHDLLRAALDVLPPGGDPPAVLERRADRLVALVLARPELIGVTAPEVIRAPTERQRADGASVYEQPDRHRWALRATLDQEAWLLDVASEPSGRGPGEGTIEAAIVEHDLGGDQATAVRELLGTDRRVGLLVGPAGAGKTRTLRAVVAAWQHTGRDVLGLTVSQAAAEVLATEAQVRAENTAKWLYESRRGRWQLPDGALVLIDEASMVCTPDLVDIVDQARRVGGKVLLVGDPAQLAAIHIGGAFDLLAERHGAARLREIRRFTEPWEANASLLLRRRDPAALAEYAMRSRIHGGTTNDIEAELYAAWQADALDSRDGRRSVLMIVTTNEQAAVLSERARHALMDTGTVDDGPTVKLRDNVASVGDHIVTRRNDRRLRTSGRGWVVNGDVWTVIRVYRDGACDARRHADGSTTTLPADYLAEHTHLAYATTAHRAQGMTVDVCHAAITADTSHEQLYVAATRGRNGNHLWVIVDSDRDIIRDRDDLPAPEEILSRVFERRDVDRLSAHQVVEDSLSETSSLARLGAIFEDAARSATDQWLRHTLNERGLAGAIDDPEWSSLISRIRETALAGHDVTALVDEAIRMRPIDDARSHAAVLHWRLGILGASSAPRSRGPLASLPPTDGPAIEVARQAGELIRQRWRDIRASLEVATDAPPGAEALGTPPLDAAAESAWLTAATAVTAYRERFEVPNHTPMLGRRPAASRPDAQAAFDHACLQADRYLARRLRHLNDQELADLDAQQQAIIDSPPPFDPADLHQARHALVQAREEVTGTAVPGAPGTIEHARLRVARLERAAQAHLDWRRTATEAADLLRQITLEQQRKRQPLTRTATPTRAAR